MSKILNVIKKNMLNFKDGLIKLVLIITIVACLGNVIYLSVYLIPQVKVTHAVVSSDLYEFVVAFVGFFTWVTIMFVKRPGFFKGFIALFGPFSIAACSARFIYVFHSTRDLFIDTKFFKIFGFLFSHSYTKEEYLKYGFSYLKSHDAPSGLYNDLSNLYDTHCVDNISDWSLLLDSLLSKSNNVVGSSSLSFWDQFLNFTATCTSFAVAHPYLIIGSFTFLVSLGIGYTVWYNAVSPTIINSSQSEVISHGNDISKILLERDDFVLSESRLALSNINVLHNHVKVLAQFSARLFKCVASLSLCIVDTQDLDSFRRNVAKNLDRITVLVPGILKITKEDFPIEGQKLGHGPLKLEERAARLARFEKGLNPTDNEN